MWYSPQELTSFKFQFKQLCLINGVVNKTQQQQQIIDNENGNLRGVESCTMERQLRRHQTIQCTVSAHKKGYSDEQTAMISRQCSQWNERVAFVQACRDYAEVYEPTIMPTIPTIPKCPPRFPFEMKKRNSSCSVEASSTSMRGSFTRRVRRRTI